MCPIEHATSGTVPRFRALQIFLRFGEDFFQPEGTFLLAVHLDVDGTHSPRPPTPQLRAVCRRQTAGIFLPGICR